MFTVNFEDSTIPIALVQPLSEVQEPRPKNIELKLYCLHENPRDKSIFIRLNSVIRSAFLVPGLDHPGCLVPVDVIDTDMFLRMRAMFLMPSSQQTGRQT